MGIEIIRNTLLTITAAATMISVLIKVFNDLFIEVIKSRYRNVPGQQSIIECVIKGILAIVLVVDMIFASMLFIWILLSVINFFVNGFNWALDNNYYYKFTPIGLVGGIILVLLFIEFVGIVYLFFKLKDGFISKLEGKNIEGIDKCCLNEILICLIVSALFFLIYTIYILSTYSQMSTKEVVTFGILWIHSLAVIVVSLNMIKVYKDIIGKEKYCIYLRNEIKSCNLYLEYKDYYMIYENYTEVYIRKSEVTKITKFNEEKLREKIRIDELLSEINMNKDKKISLYISKVFYNELINRGNKNYSIDRKNKMINGISFKVKKNQKENFKIIT